LDEKRDFLFTVITKDYI